MPGVATVQLLTYSEIVDVDMDATNDVNFADVEDYGHRVKIEMSKDAINNYLRWSRAVGSARPAAALDSSKEASFKDALSIALTGGFVDIDGVTGGLHFGTSNLDTNPDPRLRADGITANDLPLCFVLYKLYGSSAAQTLNYIYNMEDAYGMLTNVNVVTAITESFKAQVSGSLNTMFRDLLSADPHRFFDASGLPMPGIFETNADVAGSGNWNIIDNDTLEVKLKLIFHSRVTRRGVAGREHNLTSTATEDAAGPQENQQTVINPDDYFYIRLQIKAVSTATPPPPAPSVVADGNIIKFTAASYSSGTLVNTGSLGAANNATVQSGSIVKNALGNGIILNGSSHLEFPAPSLANLPSWGQGSDLNWTFSAWYKPTATAVNQAAIVTQVLGGEFNGYIYSTGGMSYTGGFYRDTFRDAAGVALDINTWTHICVTRTVGTGIDVYINGQLSVSDRGLTGNSGSGRYYQEYRIGRGIWGTYVTGELGELLMYSRPLSAAEVLQNYNATYLTYI
jgi:hypothetical protein